MRNKAKVPTGLEYLKNKPKRLKWKVVAGNEYGLDYYQTYDLIYDDYDLRIRKLNEQRS